jgi:hypothetical protein
LERETCVLGWHPDLKALMSDIGKWFDFADESTGAEISWPYDVAGTGESAHTGVAQQYYIV